MVLNFTAAHSSRVGKNPQRRNPLLKRSSSSTFTNSSTRKSAKRLSSKQDVVNEHENSPFDEHLKDLGLINCLGTDIELNDIPQLIGHVLSHRFDELPEAGGFNSTRISKILAFRKALPPILTTASIHGLTPSTTRAEREISELTKGGIIRKFSVPGRDIGGPSVGEGIALSGDVDALVRQARGLDSALANKFLTDIHQEPVGQTFRCGGNYTAEEITALMRAGFLTSRSGSNHSGSILFRSSSASASTATSIPTLSRAVSGSVAAVGGEDAIHNAGGRSGFRQMHLSKEKESLEQNQGSSLQRSLPGMGPYLKLVTAARSHLISLIEKAKFRELPLYLLRERWEGHISADDHAAKSKKYRGEFAGVLPARTRKWKQFNGLAFDWVLAECLGAGLIEIFETGSVGHAARLL
ncbi:uncharacterized protein KY384_009044 [Bacidia gigantensis]|uniref:uncharacterized protein n=1 Tax=Bacidia gigantensis TaxID=2732470 RepID=UPI001D03B8A4|nr:uncharacterized protein KY384_009044 [Bacidia gigantensis]KAG8525400.1 hypothetical protein KY384_009044 [Bacidia gigantensis]